LQSFFFFFPPIFSCTIASAFFSADREAKYKLCLDPDLDAIKKICISLRRNAKVSFLSFHFPFLFVSVFLSCLLALFFICLILVPVLL
jgi:hypothetical protein